MPLAPDLSPLRRLLMVFCLAGLSGCAETPPYHYTYVPGKTATLSEGQATIPPAAPSAVAAAINAGNEIAGSPYSYGGGHRAEEGGGFDCSGATSYVLRASGRLRGSMPSQGFRHYGESGYGRWISVYARSGHVFLVVAGLRFDTGYNGQGHSGPRWTTRDRPAAGYVVRHPPGL